MKNIGLLLSILLGLICSSVSAQQKIVGGSTINITEAPWTAAVQTNGFWNGSGVILSPDIVITAAHVVNEYSASQIKVGVGITQLANATSANLYGVKQIIYHPQYDIALLKLSRTLSYNNSVRPIDFIPTNSYSIGTNVRVTGFGKTKRPTEDPFQTEQMTRLYKMEASIVANSAYASSDPEDVVIYNGGSSATHNGDSGGPMTVWNSSLQKYTLIGVVGHGDTYYSCGVKTSYILDFLLPHYPVSITGGSDQVCTASTFSVSYPNSTVTWSCTGPLRITSQSNTSCTVSSTGNGTAVLKATIKSGNYTKTVERKLISGGYTSCTISYGNSVNGNSDTWCTSHSGNYFSIESDYDLNSYEVRLKKYPGLQVVMTTTASKGQNTLNYMLSQGWYTMEARLLGCKNGDWVTTGEVEAVDCSSNYSFSLTPNPATNVVTLTLDDVNTPDPRVPATFTVAEGGKYEVQIWSETALMKKYTFDRPAVDIPVSDLRSGRYFVLVIVNGKKLTQQLIIR